VSRIYRAITHRVESRKPGVLPGAGFYSGGLETRLKLRGCFLVKRLRPTKHVSQEGGHTAVGILIGRFERDVDVKIGVKE
jgi:hypothetical protein